MTEAQHGPRRNARHCEARGVVRKVEDISDKIMRQNKR
jgi:hypothetical protein